jgi:hypothetical protein
MIIQQVVKGIGNISRNQAEQIFYSTGIICTWWREVDPLPVDEKPQRLTERNLDWHQNKYEEPDPRENGQMYHLRTPFISTTAGTVERRRRFRTNVLNPAWLEALRFGTDFGKRDAYLFYCYVFILGRRAVGHESFAEELRELNIFTDYSPYQPEGEITAKIAIPPAQIEKVEFWTLDQIRADRQNNTVPQPSEVLPPNPSFIPPHDYNNVRRVLSRVVTPSEVLA